MKTYYFIIAFICIPFVFTACNKEQKWEYKVLTMYGNAYGEHSSRDFEEPTDTLNKLGQEGWEVVGVYTETETAYPDFGGRNLIIHYKENVRTLCVRYILKRPYTNKGKAEETSLVDTCDIVCVDTACVDTI